MRNLIFCGATLLSAVFLPTAATYAQDPPALLTRNGDTFACADYELCDLGDTCDSSRPLCETLPTGAIACTSSIGAREDLICCDTAADCGSVGTATGACIAVGTTGLKVCVYPGSNVFASCIASDAISLENARACWTSPDGGDPATWVGGDCDGDFLTNAQDPCPCDHDNGCVEPVDAGPGDGGLEDAGTEDMGTDDLGSTEDASTGVRGVSFNGDGGCAAAGPGADALPAVFGLVALAAFARRRRRAP